MEREYQKNESEREKRSERNSTEKRMNATIFGDLANGNKGTLRNC